MVEADFLFTALTSSLNKDDLIKYLSSLSEKFPFQKIFVTGLQVKENVVRFPSNVEKVASPLDFAEKLKNL
jgi:hypothetical protein